MIALGALSPLSACFGTLARGHPPGEAERAAIERYMKEKKNKEEVTKNISGAGNNKEEIIKYDANKMGKFSGFLKEFLILVFVFHFLKLPLLPILVFIIRMKTTILKIHQN